jgi:hypothetical protein
MAPSAAIRAALGVGIARALHQHRELVYRSERSICHIGSEQPG